MLEEERDFWNEVAAYLKDKAPFDIYEGAFVKVTEGPDGYPQLDLQLAVLLEKEVSEQDKKAVFVRTETELAGQIYTGYANVETVTLPAIEVPEDIDPEEAAGLIVRQLAEAGAVYVPAAILN